MRLQVVIVQLIGPVRVVAVLVGQTFGQGRFERHLPAVFPHGLSHTAHRIVPLTASKAEPTFNRLGREGPTTARTVTDSPLRPALRRTGTVRQRRITDPFYLGTTTIQRVRCRLVKASYQRYIRFLLPFLVLALFLGAVSLLHRELAGYQPKEVPISHVGLRSQHDRILSTATWKSDDRSKRWRPSASPITHSVQQNT